MKRATSGGMAVVGLLLLIALPAPADKGYADFSIWNRSLLYRDPLSDRPSSAETVLHLEAVQNITNYGTVSLWTDVLTGSDGGVRISRISAGWTGFRYKRMLLSATLGDENIVNTNLESRFVNQYHPYLYFRGFSASAAAEAFDLAVFGGKAARLSGLLGSSYIIKDQPVFGIKGRWKPGPGLIAGAAVIHTRPDPADVSVAGLALPGKNTVLMLDAEARVFERAKILGEFRTSLTPEESPSPGAANALRLGPLVRAGKWDVEANYRYSGSRFQEVNRESQIGRNERGLFSSVRYQLSRNLTLFGIVDRFADNTDRDPGANTTRAWTILSGFHLNTRSLLNLTAQWEFQDRLLEQPLAGKLRYGANGVFIQASKTLGSFFPYLRLRLQSVRDPITPELKTFVPALYAGFRKMLSSGSFFWVEGQFDERSIFDEKKEEEEEEDGERIVSDRTFILRTGWNQSFSPNLDLYSELFYERYGKVRPISQIVGYLSLRIGLPKDLELRIDLRATEPLNQREIRSSNYQLNLRVNKRFSWGLEPKILGRQVVGGEAIGLGTIDGFVFDDRDRDGIPGAGEKGLAGVSLRLEDGSKTVTGSDGRYRFENVAEGPHQVRIEENRIPATYYLLSPGRVNVLVEPRQIRQVTFLLISGASLSGRFLDDTNRNGKADPEDKGLADIQVVLTPVAKTGPEAARPAPADAGLILNTYSDADGHFRFVNILPGEYELSVDPATLPQGSAVTVPLPSKIVLEPGQSMTVPIFLIAPRPVIRKK